MTDDSKGKFILFLIIKGLTTSACVVPSYEIESESHSSLISLKISPSKE